MVGTSTDNPDPDSVLLIPSSETVYNVDTISGVEIINSTFTVDSPDLIIDLLVN